MGPLSPTSNTPIFLVSRKLSIKREMVQDVLTPEYCTIQFDYEKTEAPPWLLWSMVNL